VARVPLTADRVPFTVATVPSALAVIRWHLPDEAWRAAVALRFALLHHGPARPAA
jgi:hypothetical protein